MTNLNKFINIIASKNYLYDYNNYKKFLLIITNIIFFIGAYILYNKNEKRKNIYIFFLICAGIVSTIYHINQCYSPNYKNFKNSQGWDIILVSLMFIYFIFNEFRNINLKSFILLILAFIFWFKGDSNYDRYIYYHSLWHIFGGLFVFSMLNII